MHKSYALINLTKSKFQSVIVGNNSNHIAEFHKNDGSKISVTNEVTVLGIQIDEQLKI